MKVRSILLVLMFLMSSISFSAKAANKEEDYQKSYNYKRAVELLLNDQNESEAMRFLLPRSMTTRIMAMPITGLLLLMRTMSVQVRL